MSLSDTIAEAITNEFICDVLRYTANDSPIDYGPEGRAIVKTVATLKRAQLRLDNPEHKNPKLGGKSVELITDRELLQLFQE